MANIVLVAHDISVPLYGHRSKEFSSRLYFLAKRFEEVHAISKEQLDGREIIVRDQRARNIVVHRIPRDLVSSNIGVSRIARSVGGDVVMADCIWHAQSCLLCRKKDRIPLVVFVQTFISEQRDITLKLKLGAKPVPGLLSKVFAFSDSIMLRSSDEVICASRSLFEYAKALIPRRDWGKIKLVPYSLEYVKKIPTDAVRWADGVMESLRVRSKQELVPIMHIGARPDKGTNVALEALKFVVGEFPGAVMIIMGKAIDPWYLKKAKKLSLEDNTVFMERLPRERALALLSRASVLLLPSFTEGFGLALAEAMALGVPVVTYQNSPMRIAASRGAVIGMRTADPRQYAKEVVSMIKDEGRRERILENAKKYINPQVDFSEEERLELISGHIEDLLKAQ